MPLIEKVFNASLERHEVMVSSRVFTFNPRQLTDVPEQYVPFLESDHSNKGLIVIRHGDDFKKRERQALISYIEWLDTRIKNYVAESDEIRRRGGTIEVHPRLAEAKRWKEEIIKKLSIERPVEEARSFFDEKYSANEFEGLFQAKKTEAVEVPKSFMETDVSRELGAA